MPAPKALFFDVFGTCVDWRASLIRAAAAYDLQPGFADDWRARYQPPLESVRSGARPWTVLDVLHRERSTSCSPRYEVDLAEGSAPS